MENTALIFALLTLYFTIAFTIKGEKSNYVLLMICYLCAIFSHERYITLIIFIMVAFYIASRKKFGKFLKYIVFPVLEAIFFLGIRIIIFGSRFADGTGGTNISDTFSVRTFFQYIIDNICYLFGVNNSEVYLNGISFDALSIFYKIIIIIGDILVLTIIISFIIISITDGKKYRSKDQKALTSHNNTIIALLFAIYIVMCIIGSSVTIRVEMRWMYSSYIALIMMILFMAYELITYFSNESSKNNVVYSNVKWKNIVIFAVFGLTVCSLLSENNYQRYYKNIYYWGVRNYSRSLATVSLGKYGTNFYNLPIILVKDSEKGGLPYDTENMNQFFEAITPNIDVNLNITIVDRVETAAKVFDDNNGVGIVLLDDYNNCRVVDITDYMREIDIEYIDGYYGDSWCAKDMILKAGMRGYNSLEINYASGVEQDLSVYINDSETPNMIVHLIAGGGTFSVPYDGNDVVTIKFHTDYEQVTPPDQRRLSWQLYSAERK